MSVEAIGAGTAARAPKLLLGLGMLSAASTGVVVLAPSIGQTRGAGGHPSYLVLYLTGLVLIALTGVFLAFASRVMSLSRAWLLFALIYNAMIIAAKFVLSPVALYQTTFQLGLLSVNPNDRTFIYASAGVTFALWAGVFAIIAAVYRRKTKRAMPADDAQTPPPPGKKLVVGFCLGLIALPIAGTLLWVGGIYLNAVFATTGGILLFIIGIAFAAGLGAFSQASSRTLAVRDMTLMASFIWMGLALILMYHIVWVIYTGILVGAWPLKTVAPSGK